MAEASQALAGSHDMDQPPARDRRQLLQVGITLLSSTLGNVLTVLLTGWLVRSLGAEAFGRVAILSSAATALGNVTASGAALYVVRATSVGSTDDTGVATRRALGAAALAGQLCAALFTGAGLLLALGRHEVLGLTEWALVALALHMITADIHAKNCLIGYQKVLALSVATLIGAVLSCLCQFTGAQMGGPQGYLAGFTLGTVLQLLSSRLVMVRVMGRTPPLGLRARWAGIREPAFLRFVLPATLSASLVPGSHWCANAIAAAKAGQYSDIAVLTVAMQFFNIVIFVPTVLNKIVLPRTIRAYNGHQGMAETRQHALGQAALMFGLSIAAPLLVWIFSGPIQKAYLFSAPEQLWTLYAFCAASAFACAGIPISNYVVSHQKMTFGLLTNVLWAGAYLLLAWMLPGTALAVGLALLIAYVMTLAVAVVPLFSQN